MKQNDQELLEFDPDELVAEEEEGEDQEIPVEGELTVDVLSRWENMLIQEKSLGTLKKVLIAVKNAAADVSGEESRSGNVKYILTDPQGICPSVIFANREHLIDCC